MSEPVFDQDRELEEDLERARTLARLMDSQFEVMGIQFGADAILGLLPGVGDTLALAIACYPIHLARKHRLGRMIELQMIRNVTVDWAVGLVPLMGDLFDVAYKANLKNYELLEKAARKRRK